MLTNNGAERVKANFLLLGIGTAALAAVLAATPHVARATMTATSAGVTSFTTQSATVPPPGDLGYIFYGTVPTATGSGNGTYTPSSSNSTFTNTFSNPVSWATVALEGNYGYQGVNYPNMTINGTEYHVGTYNNSGTTTNNISNVPGNVATLLTITLGAGAPSNFEFSVLDDIGGTISNNGGAVDLLSGDVATGVYSPGSVTMLASTLDNRVYNTQYAFYHFDIVGAAAGDVFTLADTVASTNYQAVTGGIAFDAVPEPGALGLLAAGGLGMLLVKRRRTA
jgi:hypothetical protein